MSTLPRLRKALALTTIAAAMIWGVGASSTGCSSDAADNNTPDAAAQDCPVTVVAAQGKACTQPGLNCGISYACGQFLAETARCTCTGGKFDCVSPQGKPIDDPASPKCTPPGGGNDVCPADQNAAENAPCKTQGQQCPYAGFTCPGNTTKNTDICFCTGGTPASADAAVPLVYRCEIKGCTPPSDGAIPDTGTVPVDANGPG
jgi:hypothetical protein